MSVYKIIEDVKYLNTYMSGFIEPYWEENLDPIELGEIRARKFYIVDRAQVRNKPQLVQQEESFNYGDI